MDPRRGPTSSAGGRGRPSAPAWAAARGAEASVRRAPASRSKRSSGSAALNVAPPMRRSGDGSGSRQVARCAAPSAVRDELGGRATPCLARGLERDPAAARPIGCRACPEPPATSAVEIPRGGFLADRNAGRVSYAAFAPCGQVRRGRGVRSTADADRKRAVQRAASLSGRAAAAASVSEHNGHRADNVARCAACARYWWSQHVEDQHRQRPIGAVPDESGAAPVERERLALAPADALAADLQPQSVDVTRGTTRPRWQRYVVLVSLLWTAAPPGARMLTQGGW